jgi:hypothetical protein
MLLKVLKQQDRESSIKELAAPSKRKLGRRGDRVIGIGKDFGMRNIKTLPKNSKDNLKRIGHWA